MLNIFKKIAVFFLGALFLSGLVFGLWYYTGAAAFAPEKEGIAVPILMYHNITDKAVGSKYTVTAAELEADLNYIEEKGYTAVGINDLIAYVKGEGDLPEKSIVLTFDDGYESVYVLGLPLFKKYGCKAVVGVIGELTELFTEEEDHNIEYSHLNWEEINEMSKSGFVEFQNHTYALHEIKNGRKGAAQKKGEDAGEYKKILTEDVSRLNDEILSYTGVKPTAFIYPYGNFNENTEIIIKEMGFEAILNCYEKVNYIKNPEDLLGMCRFLRPSGVSSGEIFKKIEEEAAE
ncbi:MAG: polysaccharide deacetylase family protein [Clostridiales bacterium]|nr:polysaccharide deacetylase family protein [Clostridiales bacterium]